MHALNTAEHSRNPFEATRRRLSVLSKVNCSADRDSIQPHSLSIISRAPLRRRQPTIAPCLLRNNASQLADDDRSIEN